MRIAAALIIAADFILLQAISFKVELIKVMVEDVTAVPFTAAKVTEEARPAGAA